MAMRWIVALLGVALVGARSSADTKSAHEHLMSGLHLTIVTTEDPPFMKVRDSPNDPIKPWTEWEGWIKEVIQAVSDAAGFTYTLQLSSSTATTAYGQSDKDVVLGRWRGDPNGTTSPSEYEAIHQGGFGVGPPTVHWAGAYITENRLDAMSMTAPFQYSPLSLMIKSNEAQGSNGAALINYMPPKLLHWILSTWIISSIVFFLCETDTLSAHLTMRKALKLWAEKPISPNGDRRNTDDSDGHSYSPPDTPELEGAKQTDAAKALRMRELQEVFAELDGDGNGTIEWVELEAAMVQHSIPGVSVTQMIQTVEHKSPDGCSFDEFARMVLSQDPVDSTSRGMRTEWIGAAANDLLDSLCTGALTLSGLTTFSPRTRGGRLITSAWNFLCFIFVATSMANCNAYMLKEMTEAIDSQEYNLDRFLSSGKVCVLGGSAYSNFLSNHKTYKYLKQYGVTGNSESSPLKEMVKALDKGECDGIIERKIHLDFVAACASRPDRKEGQQACERELGTVDKRMKIVDHLRGGPSELAIMSSLSSNPQIAAKLSYWVASLLNDRTLSLLYEEHVKVQSRTTQSSSQTSIHLEWTTQVVSDLLLYGIYCVGAGLCVISVSRHSFSDWRKGGKVIAAGDSPRVLE